MLKQACVGFVCLSRKCTLKLAMHPKEEYRTPQNGKTPRIQDRRTVFINMLYLGNARQEKNLPVLMVSPFSMTSTDDILHAHSKILDSLKFFSPGLYRFLSLYVHPLH